MIPSDKDIKNRENKLNDFLSKIDENGKSTEKQMLAVVRSSIRKAWMRSPTKLAYLYSKTLPDMDDNTKTKWKIQCECCKSFFKINEVEVDHKHGNHSLLSIADFENFFNKILMVGFDDLQILCKNCHDIKSYSEKFNMTLEDAEIEKKIIEICNSKNDKTWLEERNIIPSKNISSRKAQIREILKGST